MDQVSGSPLNFSDSKADQLSPFVGEGINGLATNLFIVLGVFLFISGTFGNILVLVTLLKCPALHSVHYVYVANLALSDLIIEGYSSPFVMYDLLLGYQPVINNAHCIFNGFLVVTCYVSSLFTLASISFNRYMHVCQHTLYKRYVTRRLTLTMCALVWVLSIGVGAAPLLGWGRYAYDVKTHYCGYDRMASMSYAILIAVGTIALPATAVCYFNLSIFRFVKGAKTRVNKWKKSDMSDNMDSKCSNIPGYGSKGNEEVTVEAQTSDVIPIEGKQLSKPYCNLQDTSQKDQDDIFSSSSEITYTDDALSVQESQCERRCGLNESSTANKFAVSLQYTSSEQTVTTQICLGSEASRNCSHSHNSLHSESPDICNICLKRTNPPWTNGERNGQNVYLDTHNLQCDCKESANECCFYISEEQQVDSEEYFQRQTSPDISTQVKNATVVYVRSVHDDDKGHINKALSSNSNTRENDMKITQKSLSIVIDEPHGTLNLRTTNTVIGAMPVDSQDYRIPTTHINVIRSVQPTAGSELNSSVGTLVHDSNHIEINTLPGVSHCNNEHNNYTNPEDAENNIQQTKDASRSVTKLGRDSDSKTDNRTNAESDVNFPSNTNCLNMSMKNIRCCRPNKLNLATSNTTHRPTCKTSDYLGISQNSHSSNVNKSKEDLSSNEDRMFLSKTSAEWIKPAGSVHPQQAETSRNIKQRSKLPIPKTELSMIKTLFVVFVCLSIFMSPYMVTILVDTENEWPALAHCACSYLAVVNNAINWMLYGLMNKSFRMGYRVVLTSIFKKTCKKPFDHSDV